MTRTEPSNTPLVTGAAERRRLLTSGKRRATGLLVVVAVAYVLTLATTDDEGTAGLVRTALEASLVGGLADWFAVTALFRHPLGLPIPHTAVIRSRKDQFGATLAEFVGEQFLTPEVVGERVRAAGVADRLARWGARPANAERVAAHGVEILSRLSDALGDDEVHGLVEETIRERVAQVPLAPMAARVLRVATDESRHHELVDAVLAGVDRFLADNEATLRDRFVESAPWWVPDAVDNRIFDRLLRGVRDLLEDGRAKGELRRRLDHWVATSIWRLERDTAWAARLDELRNELLAHPELRSWIAAVWTDTKTQLRVQADDPDSALRARGAELVRAAAVRLVEDHETRALIDDRAESFATQLTGQFSGEIRSLIESTVARWDADETSDRLELLLGPDLQFIRINGTVVGGLAGVALHLASGLI